MDRSVAKGLNASWFHGDFNNDNSVDAGDYFLLDRSYAITHGNALRHFGFDPFAHRDRARCTVDALRAEAPHVDVGPAAPRRPFVAPERPLTLMDMLSKAEHPLLDEQARTEGVDA